MRSRIVDVVQSWGFPGWVVPDYWFMLTAAIVIASLYTLRVWRSSGGDPRTVSDLLFWGIPSLLIGARLGYFLQYGFPQSIWEIPSSGGWALYGGLAGLLTAWMVVWLLRPFPILRFLDSVTPGLALGLFVGRLGCFLAGCNAGSLCDLPWAVRFPAGTAAFSHQIRDGILEPSAGLSLPVHPAQLYESFFGLVAFLLLARLLRSRRWEGEVFVNGMIWYSVFRFSIEFVRNDSGGWAPFGILTFAQMVSLLLLGLAVVVTLAAPRPQMPGSPATMQ
ncbi:MAG: prolipoprotein diacylglyceryl transferase family protein [Acidobacteriota bacterium]